MYGSLGVCTVTSIGVPDFPGASRECYVLRPHYVANSKVYAPVEQNAVKMRELLTPEQAQSLIDSLPSIRSFPLEEDKQQRYETYRSAIKSTDSMLLAKLLKTLHEKKQQVTEQRKVFPSAEKEFFDTAEKMLYGELAAVLQLPLDEMAGYVASRVGLQAAAS